MRKLFFFMTLAALSACAKQKPERSLARQRSGPPPALAGMLPPDASHDELEAALRQVTPSPADRSAVLEEMSLTSKRIFAWQALLNGKRPAGRRLRFDRDVKGIPIEQPYSYDGDSVIAEYQAALDALNPEMKAVIGDLTAPLPGTLATADDEFEARAKKVIAAYDHAMRWEALSPYLDHYRSRDVDDVRGYWFLSRTPDLEEKLAHWKKNPPDEARKLANWLLGVCRNGRVALADCMKELGPQETADDVRPFWRAHSPSGRKLLDWYFSLAEPRGDVRWFHEGTLEGPRVPFTAPARAEIGELARSLIEGAWQGVGWRLRLGFTGHRDEETPHLVFEPGALPHVDRVGGSEITMDENVPADNELASRVLQHEFGHVLGFPDCYVELYDEIERKMVNYQIDTGNIMCSRAGKVTNVHWDALRAAYVGPGKSARGPSSGKRGRATR